MHTQYLCNAFSYAREKRCSSGIGASYFKIKSMLKLKDKEDEERDRYKPVCGTTTAEDLKYCERNAVYTCWCDYYDDNKYDGRWMCTSCEQWNLN